MRARWEGDTRGEGVADGSRLAEGIEELRRLASVQIRAAVLCLIGQIAETGTYIRQRREPLSFEVLTGVVGDSPFASHGHLLILRIVGYDPP